jgi:hypothetical protein
MSRSAPPIIRLARSVAGEAAPKERVRVFFARDSGFRPRLSSLCHSERSKESRLLSAIDLRLPLSLSGRGRAASSRRG